jgi:hypothetical protein
MSTVAHLTLAEYDRLIAAGMFELRERNRLELIPDIGLRPASLWQGSQ